MADLSIFKLDNQSITIKDTTARQTAESAKALATAAATAGNAVREQITELKSAFEQVAKNIPNLFTGTFDESGYVDPSTGANKSSSSYKRTSYYYPVKIAGGNKVYFKISAATANMQIVIYNADKSAVQATASRNNTTSETILTITGDGYFRLYTNAAFDGDVYVGQMPFANYGTYDNYKITMDSIDNAIKNPLELAGHIYQETGVNLFDVNSPNVKHDFYLDTSGNQIPLADWNISDYIRVDDYASIVGSVYTSAGAYYAYCKLNYLHTYDANREHIGKVWDTSSDGIYTVGSGVAYIRFCWRSNETSDDKKIMVESGTAHSSNYQDYALYTKLVGSAYPEMDELRTGTFLNDESISESKLSEEVQEKLNAIAPSEINAISCWGDSLTYSQNTSVETDTRQGTVTYPGRLATLTGLECANIGMPGANSDDISGLQGGMPIYLDPFTLPADTSSVQVTLRDANSLSNYIGLMHWMPRAGWPNPVFNMGLSWKIGNFPVQLAYSGGGVLKVYRTEAAQSATVFTRPVKLVPVQNYAKKRMQIFWVGTNDAPDTSTKAEQLKNVISNMIAHYGGAKYLVVGMTVKSYADASNAILAYTFGPHYVDVKDYLIKYGLSDSNLTPTSQDSTDITNGVVPTSLRSDSVHLNDYGYTAVANCIYQHGQMMGYWE